MTRLALGLVLLPSLAWADTHSLTIRNGSAETIRSIYMAPAGSAAKGENRMRSQLPPGVEARFTYSTGCHADVRIGYESGRTEDHPGIDVCSDARIVAGQDGVAGPSMPPTPVSSKTAAKPGKNVPLTTAVRAPPPVVPPWTGKSITKKFGGME